MRLPRENRLEKSVSARVKRSLLSRDIWFFALSFTIRLFSSRLLFFCRKPASLQHGGELQNMSSALILDARGKQLYLQPVDLTIATKQQACSLIFIPKADCRGWRLTASLFMDWWRFRGVTVAMTSEDMQAVCFWIRKHC